MCIVKLGKTLYSDIFLFGARTVYREICLGDGAYVVCYEMSNIERELGLGRNSLITHALLLGSDYTKGIPGLRREAACQVVKSIGDHVILQKVASEGLSFAKKTKRSKKSVQNMYNNENTMQHVLGMNGSKHGSAMGYSYLEVIDAYLKPKCYSADSNAVYRALVQHPYQHVKVQQVCGRYFEWPTEKTDEYILPKIAERELRRFNNLRSTSSKFGVNLPLDEMPINCPVFGIIKERKVNAKECFEVSWDDLRGLKTSVVPADLVQSACPEKIVEFEEEKDPKKNRIAANQRSRNQKKNLRWLISTGDSKTFCSTLNMKVIPLLVLPFVHHRQRHQRMAKLA